MDGDGSTYEAGVNALTAANSESGTETAAPVAEPTQTQTPAVAPPVQNQGHPAWQPYLKNIPEGLHGVVKPAFEEWDKSVNQRLSEVQSRYNPYKQFVDSKVDPGQLRAAYELYSMMQSDPRRIYDAMGSNFGFADQGQEDESEEEEEEFDLGDGQQPQQRFDLTKDPHFQQIQAQQQQIVQMAQQAQQQKLEAEGDAWVSTKQSEASKVFDQAGITATPEAWAYVLHTAMGLGEAGVDNDEAFDKAVQSYVGLIHQARGMPSANTNAPLVMPASGATPSAPNPVEMDEQSRKRYGADYLRAALRDS